MQFRASDEALVSLSAVLFNRWTEANSEPSNYPEGGFSVIYREIPLSPQEMEARRKHVLEMLAAGLMSEVDALRFFGSLSEQDAIAQLAAIRVMKGAPSPTTVEGGSPPPATAPADDVSHLEAMAEAVDEDEDEAAAPATGAPVEGDSIAATAVASGQSASAVALNGAQVQAAQGIIVAVSRGELPRETGVQMLIQFFSIPADQADQLMGPVGRSFSPPAVE